MTERSNKPMEAREPDNKASDTDSKHENKSRGDSFDDAYNNWVKSDAQQELEQKYNRSLDKTVFKLERELERTKQQNADLRHSMKLQQIVGGDFTGSPGNQKNLQISYNLSSESINLENSPNAMKRLNLSPTNIDPEQFHELTRKDLELNLKKAQTEIKNLKKKTEEWTEDI